MSGSDCRSASWSPAPRSLTPEWAGWMREHGHPSGAMLVLTVAQQIYRREGITMVPAKEPVAFLGIGTMGHAMATSALRAGIPTIVWNRDPRATQDLVDLGAQAADTPAEAARRAAIVVTMVTDADVVVSIARDQGLLAALSPGAIWVQMSTIGVAGIERVKALVDVERSDVTLIDAPVSGSKDPAERGQLTIFASGPDAGPLASRPPFRCTGPANDLGGSGRGRIAAEARRQLVARARCGSGQHFSGACSSVGA